MKMKFMIDLERRDVETKLSSVDLTELLITPYVPD